MKIAFSTFRIFLLLAMSFFFQQAQCITYSFAGSSPSVAANTVISLVVPAWGVDDHDTLIHPYGFNFNFEGITYTGFIVSTNGWLVLVPSNIISIPPYFFSALPVNSLSTYAGGYPLFAPLWDDNSSSLYSYGINGSVLTVKWYSKWDKNYSGPTEALMWMTIDQSTGIITYNYSTTSYFPPPSVSASIGIAGICNGTFYSVTVGSSPSTSTVSTTIEDSLVNFKPVNGKFVFTPSTVSLTWAGTIDTLYEVGINWNDCSAPDCSVSAYIGPTISGNMPTVRKNESVHSLVIDSGATLRIKAGYILSICGDFVNNGSLIAEPGSTISFTGSDTQTVSGSFTGMNKFSHISLSKPSGVLRLANDIDVLGNFSVNTTSTFDINGKYMKVGGNFNSRYITGIANSTVEFNGTGSQQFTNNNAHLNKVKVNGGYNIYLAGNQGNMIIDSLLDLTSGCIVTSPLNEVSVLYASPMAIQNYSFNSFIYGNLRRGIYSGSIDFPVGDTSVINQGGQRGYELANITFTSPTTITNLRAAFHPFNFPPSPLGPAGPDSCGFYLNTYDSLPLYNNGYWLFENNTSQYSGTYTVTLYNTGGANAAGVGWTIATAPITNNPGSALSWSLIGQCNSSSMLQAVSRDNINSSPNPNTAFNHLYSTAQGVQVGLVNVNNPIKEKFSISPNPFNNSVSLCIYSEISGKFNFQLVDINGRLIYTRELHALYGRNILPELFLAKGIYLCRIISERGIWNEKLVCL